MRRRTVTWALAVLLAIATTACENEGRSDEARGTAIRYLEALDGAARDRGWSVLSPSMREHSGPAGNYLALAEAIDTPMAIADIALFYEDDGLYDFTVTAAEPIDEAHAAALFTPLGTSSVACRVDERTFRLAVIVGVLFFEEHAGVTGNECPKAR
ncbi:MAG: hypothetical protein M3Y40_04660 [Chloroflexota bacterium]|nr:hypothetical protein [Chloroflexota bacterium]